MPAVAAAAVIGAGASIYSANKASKAQQNAADDANATQLQMYNQTRDDQEPWRAGGSMALSELLYGLGLGDPNAPAGGESLENFNWQAYNAANPDVAQNWRGNYTDPAERAWQHYTMYGKNEGRAYTPNAGAASQQRTGEFGGLNKSFTLSDFQKDPGYQFRLDEGLKGVQSSAAARGGLLSGATLKGLERYGQDYASGEYGTAYNRYNSEQDRRFNRLATVAGIGQTANSQIGAAGQNYANNVSGNQLASGNAQSAGYIAASNGVNSAINNATSYYTMKNLFGSGGGAGGGGSGKASANYYNDYSNVA